LAKVLAFTDHVLFDLKHMNREVHLRYTGRRNDLILSNAKVVASSSVSVTWRMPLIPGVNDTLENIRATASFVKAIGNTYGIEVLPYHRLGVGKYQALGKRYPLEKLAVQAPEMITRVKETFEELGVACHIV
jgi:pyruvate formate lyase activating enzyme